MRIFLTETQRAGAAGHPQRPGQGQRSGAEHGAPEDVGAQGWPCGARLVVGLLPGAPAPSPSAPRPGSQMTSLMPSQLRHPHRPPPPPPSLLMPFPPATAPCQATSLLPGGSVSLPHRLPPPPSTPPTAIAISGRSVVNRALHCPSRQGFGEQNSMLRFPGIPRMMRRVCSV